MVGADPSARVNLNFIIFSLPKAEDGQSQQQIPQLLHSPQVQPAQLNVTINKPENHFFTFQAKMHMMNAHHMNQHPVNPNNVNVNAHMMQVDQVNAAQQQTAQQQHRPIQVSLQRQLSHDPNNIKQQQQQQQPMSHPLQQQMVAKNIQDILVKTEDDQEQRDAEKQRKKGFKIEI